MVMRNGKSDNNSGKTYYNRIKKPGESWTKLRDEARKAGTFYHEVRTLSEDAKPEDKREDKFDYDQ